MHDYSKSNAKGSTFWMSLSDFIKHFYIATISYQNPKHKLTFCEDQVFSYKWGCCYYKAPKTEKNCFVSLFQMNDRFNDFYSGNDDFQYAEMQLIVTKVINIPIEDKNNTTGKPIAECAFVDGAHTDIYNTCHVKIKKMTAGYYVFFYTAKFRRDQLCRKLNVVLHSPHDPN